jgi:hypothetical protein
MHPWGCSFLLVRLEVFWAFSSGAEIKKFKKPFDMVLFFLQGSRRLCGGGRDKPIPLSVEPALGYRKHRPSGVVHVGLGYAPFLGPPEGEIFDSLNLVSR